MNTGTDKKYSSYKITDIECIQQTILLLTSFKFHLSNPHPQPNRQDLLILTPLQSCSKTQPWSIYWWHNNADVTAGGHGTGHVSTGSSAARVHLKFWGTCPLEVLMHVSTGSSAARGYRKFKVTRPPRPRPPRRTLTAMWCSRSRCQRAL